MDVQRYVQKAEEPEEAAEIHFERLPQNVYVEIVQGRKRKKKGRSLGHVRTAEIRLTLVAEDGLSLAYTMTRNDFVAWCMTAAEVQCDA